MQRTLDLAGDVLLHPKEDDETSQWVVLLDLGGVAFGVIPVVPAEMALPVDSDRPDGAIGRIVWLDLTVSDASRARDFYSEGPGGPGRAW